MLTAGFTQARGSPDRSDPDGLDEWRGTLLTDPKHGQESSVEEFSGHPIAASIAKFRKDSVTFCLDSEILWKIQSVRSPRSCNPTPNP